MGYNYRNYYIKFWAKSLVTLAIIIANMLLNISFVNAAAAKQSITKGTGKEIDKVEQTKEGIREYPNPFEQLSREMHRLWHKIDISDNSGYLNEGVFFSPNSFYSYFNSDKKEYILNIEIPGFEKEQVKVELQGDYIIIKAQKFLDKSKKDEAASGGQKSRNSFYQKLFLPKDVNKNAISSSLKNGILTITLPKSPIKTEEIKVIPIN